MAMGQGSRLRGHGRLSGQTPVVGSLFATAVRPTQPAEQ